MEIAAGLIIIYKHKILLCHPTNAKWYTTYSIPKGVIDEGESKITCALRETFEETGLGINAEKIKNPGNPFVVNYRNKKGVITKTIYCYIVRIEKLADIGMKEEVVPKEQLQQDEIDWAGFVDFNDARERILSKQVDLLGFL